MTERRSRPREIADGIFWLGVCHSSGFQGPPSHNYVSNFLVSGGTRTLLVDTGMPSRWPEVEAQLDRVLGDRQLDWIFPTHPETPHAGNLGLLLDKYPAAMAVGDLRTYRLYFPAHADRLVTKRPGDELNLGDGHVFTFLEPAMKDHQATFWGYERKQQVLFASDGFIYAHNAPRKDEAEDDDPTHAPGECLMTTSELGSKIDVDTAAAFWRGAFYFSRFVEREVIFERIDRMLTTYPTRIIAPAHGSVIDTIDEMLPTFRAVYDRQASMEGEVELVAMGDGGYRRVLVR